MAVLLSFLIIKEYPMVLKIIFEASGWRLALRGGRTFPLCGSAFQSRVSLSSFILSLAESAGWIESVSGGVSDSPVYIFLPPPVSPPAGCRQRGEERTAAGTWMSITRCHQRQKQAVRSGRWRCCFSLSCVCVSVNSTVISSICLSVCSSSEPWVDGWETSAPNRLKLWSRWV